MRTDLIYAASEAISKASVRAEPRISGWTWERLHRQLAGYPGLIWVSERPGMFGTRVLTVEKLPPDVWARRYARLCRPRERAAS